MIFGWCCCYYSYVVCSDLKESQAPIVEYLYSVNDKINELTAMPAHMPVPKPGQHGGGGNEYGRKGFARNQRGGGNGRLGSRGEPPPAAAVPADTQMVTGVVSEDMASYYQDFFDYLRRLSQDFARKQILTLKRYHWQTYHSYHWI